MNRSPALSNFSADARRRVERQQRMSEGMVPDYVSTFGNFNRDIWPLMHIAADQKKSSMNVVPGKNIKQVESVRVVRSVVESECNLLRTALPTAESPPKPLASRRNRLISSTYQGSTGGSGREHEHGRIVPKGRNQKAEVRNKNAEVR